MLILGKSKEIVDIELLKNGASVLVKGSSLWVRIPYSAIKWVSNDWFKREKKK